MGKLFLEQVKRSLPVCFFLIGKSVRMIRVWTSARDRDENKTAWHVSSWVKATGRLVACKTKLYQSLAFELVQSPRQTCLFEILKFYVTLASIKIKLILLILPRNFWNLSRASLKKKRDTLNYAQRSFSVANRPHFHCDSPNTGFYA